MEIIWDGDSSKANEIFGENYGIDWQYNHKDSLNILVKGCLIRIGDRIDMLGLLEKIKDLQHFKDINTGLWALDTDPKQLLNKFWQRTSDACPLECSEAEKQEMEFEKFVKDLTWQITNQ